MTFAPKLSLRGRRGLLAALGVLACARAWAGACTVTTTGLAFGPYQPLTFAGKMASAHVTSDASVSIVCTGIVAGGGYSIALGPSATGNGFAPRYMAHPAGGPPMAYNIYRDAAFTSIWGDGTTGGVLSGSLPAGDSTGAHTVYGRIPAGQNMLRAGTYADALTMTVSYDP